MGRPSKLTPAQWDEIRMRVAAGESLRAMEREFGVSEAAIRQRGISSQSSQVREVAQKLAAAHAELEELPPTHQYFAVKLADDLREVTRHLVGAARLGAATSHRLAGIAHAKVQEIDDAAPLDGESVESLKGVAALTKIANDASQIGLNLLKANGEAMQQADKPKPAFDWTALRPPEADI